MEISITFEDERPEDLMIQHLAEQEDSGHVVDWVHGLIYAAIEAHPDFRFCPDLENCCELVYPTMTVRPVENSTWKKYRVATAPTLTCPRCGKATITHGQLNKRMKADPYRQERIAEGKARNRAFAEGAPNKKQKAVAS